MFNSMKSPLRKFGKHHSVDPAPNSGSSNPFDDDAHNNHGLKSSQRTTSEPIMPSDQLKANLFDNPTDNGRRNASSSSYTPDRSARNKYKNDFQETGGYENQSVQELEEYAAYKAGETTQSVNECLKIAEDMRENASQTLVNLHHQGEQIKRTHQTAADIEHDLSRGEKLLGNLGGMFSRTWKPKKNHHITGPMMTRDDSFIKRSNHKEQKERAGLNLPPKRRSRTPPPEPTNAMEQVEYEKAKQDDALDSISDILGELKGMVIDMGSEIDSQNKAFDSFYADVDEVNGRVGGANQRARRLLHRNEDEGFDREGKTNKNIKKSGPMIEDLFMSVFHGEGENPWNIGELVNSLGVSV